MTSYRPTYIHMHSLVKKLFLHNIAIFSYVLTLHPSQTEVQTLSLLPVCCYTLLLWQNGWQERRDSLKHSDNLCQEDPKGTDNIFFFSQALQLKVPKGSLLLPFLFKTHMKPLENIVKWHRLQCHQYPDDTKLYVSFSLKPYVAASLCLAEIRHGWKPVGWAFSR